MTRRRAVLFVALGFAAPRWVVAQPLTEEEATGGMLAALDRACVLAVNQLGRIDAFMGNPRLRVPLPGRLDDAAQVLLANGQRRLVGELVTAMNRAAEAAVGLAAAEIDDDVAVLDALDHAVDDLADAILVLVEKHHCRLLLMLLCWFRRTLAILCEWVMNLCMGS